MDNVTRRVALGAGAGTALIFAGCARGPEKTGGGEDVSATEDLMREHGVLRRILVVYRESAAALRGAAAGVDGAALGEAASLFRRFGEDYHERKLEEAYIFPAVRRAGGPASGLIATLLAQHDRGRQITAFIEAKCAGGKIAAGDAAPLARALDGFARMYEAHTAFEDTVVFQAWKKTMSPHQFEEMGDRFEGIERDTFRGDGFDMAVDEVGRIEQRLGLGDLDRYTAPAA
ncbi:MAG TPA: hemerythrin domain-containing protein [Caulobacteraceae bacterium]|jgi:hemerythrin-like domain-containing protein|nr:hemerythrin domain-containing protein [Caulobacteraceae bacterium]